MRSIRNSVGADPKKQRIDSTVDGGTPDDILRNAETLKQRYADKTESQLMQELLKSVSAAKANGTFSARQLDEFVGFVSPSLDESSRARLAELVEMIKGNSLL